MCAAKIVYVLKRKTGERGSCHSKRKHKGLFTQRSLRPERPGGLLEARQPLRTYPVPTPGPPGSLKPLLLWLHHSGPAMLFWWLHLWNQGVSFSPWILPALKLSSPMISASSSPSSPAHTSLGHKTFLTITIVSRRALKIKPLVKHAYQAVVISGPKASVCWFKNSLASPGNGRQGVTGESKRRGQWKSEGSHFHLTGFKSASVSRLVSTVGASGYQVQRSLPTCKPS